MIINEQPPQANVLKPSRHQLLVGYSSDEIEEMYGQAKTMQMWYAFLEDEAEMQEWSDKAIVCALTLHAMEVEV